MKHTVIFASTTFVISLLSAFTLFYGAGRADALFVGCSAVVVEPTRLDWEEEIAELVNAKRAENNLPPLKLNIALSNGARYHAADMLQDDYFEHNSFDRIDGSLQQACLWYERISKFYSGGSLGENIAFGYPNPTAVMNGWMNSSGHRANILNANFQELGVGYYERYWGQNFGSRFNVYPLIINREQRQTNSPMVQLYIYGSQWQEMRLRNDEGNWSEWQPFANNLQWTLVNSAGIRTVSVELRNSISTATSSDSIDLLAATEPSATPTETVTATPEPSNTPTYTPSPTNTAIPLATATPTEIIHDPTLHGQVTLQGRPNIPHNRWSTRLQVDLISVDGSNDDKSYTPMTDDRGHFAIRNPPQGNFYVVIKGDHTLRNVIQATIHSNGTEIDGGTLFEGDVVPDNIVNLIDFSALAAHFSSCDAARTQYDLNADGCIDIGDVTLIQENFGQESDSWPAGELQAAASSMVISDRNIEIARIESASKGEKVNVRLKINGATKTQINAGAFYFDFDPTQLAALSIQPLAPFSIHLSSEIDNTRGQAELIAGLLGEGVQVPFSFAVVTFEALTDITSTPITLSLNESRRTDIAGNGASLLPDSQIDSFAFDTEQSPALQSIYLPLVQR